MESGKIEGIVERWSMPEAGGSNMDRSRKATREGNELTLQHKSQHDALLVDELNDGKLTQLIAFVSRLEKTPPGA